MSLFSPSLRAAKWHAAALLAAPALVQATAYTLDTAYAGSNFFDGWDFFTGTDPTFGYVNYVSRDSAMSLGLAVPGTPTYIGVDHTTYLNSSSTTGRKSVRIESTQSWTHGLFIADIEHMPGGICGTWPAYWMYGPDWPDNGEIDIIEGVNTQADNLMTLHANSPVGECTIAGSGELGTLQTNDCNYQANNYGSCGISGAGSSTYGTGFNAIDGGVYAMEWTSDYIKIWFFPRGAIPSDISAGSPNPSTWSTPQANFAGSCDFDEWFNDNHLVINTDFCGSFGDALWASSGCQSANSGMTCEQYVAQNPQAFAEAYWSFNSLRVYQAASPITNTTSSPSSIQPSSTLVGPGMGGTVTISATTTPPALSTGTPGNGTSSGGSGSGSGGSGSGSGGSGSLSNAKPSGYVYEGCFLSSAVASQGNASIADNSPSACTTYCTRNFGNDTYAELSGTSCTCSAAVDMGGKVSDASCNIPCPGDSALACGGSSALSKRATPISYVSVYKRSAGSGSGTGSGSGSGGSGSGSGGSGGSGNGNGSGSGNGSGGSGSGNGSGGSGNGSGSGTAVTATVVAPQSEWITTVVQTVYTDVCPGGLTTKTAFMTTTISVLNPHCGCLDTSVTMPMTTVTTTCDACATPLVTLTVPATVIVPSTATVFVAFISTPSVIPPVSSAAVSSVAVPSTSTVTTVMVTSVVTVAPVSPATQPAEQPAPPASQSMPSNGNPTSEATQTETTVPATATPYMNSAGQMGSSMWALGLVVAALMGL